MGSDHPTTSTLLLDELFSTGDSRFLRELLNCKSEPWLAAFSARWVADARPFAREMMLAYVDAGCDAPNHRVLVKRLFKDAEAAQDDALMARFLVAFDRLNPRRLVTRRRYDWQSRQTLVEVELDVRADRGVPARIRVIKYRDSKTGKVIEKRAPSPRFSRRTRSYLARRAFRYFRRLGHRDPLRYRTAISAALALYRDDSLSGADLLLNSWGLLHALYWGSPVLRRLPSGVVLAPGRTLKELEPDPIHAEAWQGCLDELLALLKRAQSRTVRQWVVAWLKRTHAAELRTLSVTAIVALLRSANEESQTFGAELLSSTSGLGRLALEDWLELLKVENPGALSLVCQRISEHVTPERLTLAQCVELACAQAAPVAELGFTWLQGKPLAAAAELSALTPLANARAPQVRASAVEWLAKILVGRPDSTPELVRELLDSRYPDTRARALQVLESAPRFGESPVLWGALAETPYDDVRATFVQRLDALAAKLPAESLRSVWATSLLAVHRGGRAKRAVAGQIANRIIERPGEASELLPLLGIALRSIRAPERTAALAAIGKASASLPALREAIAAKLPELKLLGDEVTA